MALSRKSELWREIKHNRVAYAYISPFYILFCIFGLFPIAAGFFISFFSWDGLSPMHFKAFGNYLSLFQDKLFWKSLYNTLFIGIIAHIPILFGGLVLAYIMNSKLVKFENVFKTMYFMPMVTSSVAVTIVFQAMFGYNFGIVNYVIQGLGFDKIDWFGGNGSFVKVAIIIMFAWKWVGWNMVIYLSGMQGISSDIYEAATIDGATHVDMLLQITIPLLKPIIIYTVIQSTIGTINLFTEPYVLTNGLTGGTGNQGLTAMMYLLNKAPQGNNLYGYASACAYVLSFIIIIVSTLNMNLFDEDRREKRGKRA